MTTRNLWGNVPETKEDEDSPLAILREQGQRLAEKTNNEVRGYVPIRPFDRVNQEIRITSSGQQYERRDMGFTADFYFEVPNLNSYRYLFLEVELPVSMGYPVKLKDHINAEETVCASREAFEQTLQAAFTSEAVRDVIAGLRTASRSMNQTWSPQASHD